MVYRYFLLLGLVCFPLAAQECEEGPAKPAVIPEAVKSSLAARVPTARELGATGPGERRFYGSDLWTYMDGGAEPYHGYGMVAMVHQEYKIKDTELTIDVFDMGDPLSAFGIYSSERAPEYKYLAIGTEGHGEDAVLNFLQGQYYVKLAAVRESGSSAPLLATCAAQISKRIGGGKTMPEGLKLLPAANRVAHSEKFIKTAPLGHIFLAPAYLASYMFEGKPSTVALSLAANSAEARSRADQLGKYFTKLGKLVPRPDLGPGANLGSTSYEGEMVYVARGRYLVMVVNPPADHGSFLKTLIGAIPEAD
jgi:hypothetical protein